MRKISPLKRYERPAYPTIDEIGLADLSRAPVRWARLRSVVASLGTVALTMRAFAQDAAPAAPTTVAALATPFAEPASNQTATVRGTKPYVLTCEGHFNKSLRRAAEALGAKTVEVLSRNSLLVEADAAAVARLRADRRFSVEREFLPSDKIAPALADKIAGGAGAVEVAVVTLSADDHRRVQDRVVARGGEILTGCFNEGTTFRARMRLRARVLRRRPLDGGVRPSADPERQGDRTGDDEREQRLGQPVA